MKGQFLLSLAAEVDDAFGKKFEFEDILKVSFEFGFHEGLEESIEQK